MIDYMKKVKCLLAVSLLFFNLVACDTTKGVSSVDEEPNTKSWGGIPEPWEASRSAMGGMMPTSR